MKKYKAYTCQGFNCEKFYIDTISDDGYNVDLVIEAESSFEAEKLFIENIFETSLYSDSETKEWLSKNPLYVVECNDDIGD